MDIEQTVSDAAYRIVVDVMLEATIAYWRRRADQLEWARPQPRDWFGQAVSADVLVRDMNLAETVLACRNHARLLAGEVSGD